MRGGITSSKRGFASFSRSKARSPFFPPTLSLPPTLSYQNRIVPCFASVPPPPLSLVSPFNAFSSFPEPVSRPFPVSYLVSLLVSFIPRLRFSLSASL